MNHEPRAGDYVTILSGPYIGRIGMIVNIANGLCDIRLWNGRGQINELRNNVRTTVERAEIDIPYLSQQHRDQWQTVEHQHRNQERQEQSLNSGEILDC